MYKTRKFLNSICWGKISGREEEANSKSFSTTSSFLAFDSQKFSLNFFAFFSSKNERKLSTEVCRDKQTSCTFCILQVKKLNKSRRHKKDIKLKFLVQYNIVVLSSLCMQLFVHFVSTDKRKKLNILPWVHSKKVALEAIA